LNTRYETDRDLHHDLRDLDDAGRQDREISLGTTTILGIFFALALLCAVFFGFGYSLGRRSALPSANPTAATAGSENSDSKPSPGSPVSQTEKRAVGAESAIVPMDSDPAAQDTQQSPNPHLVKASASNHLDPAANTITRSPAITAAAAATTPGSSVVQIAAMSHQEDADVVAVDLKRRGYTVAIRHESQDKLFHVQIGPFGNRKEADAMRQRLQTDGYNSAIVK
jgi:DedD protein